MTESSVCVYVPSMDGEYVPVKFTSREEDMKDTDVLIFLDEESKQIFIWTGENSSVRKRFISSQIARQMRLEKGLTHRISTEDQGNETIKFKSFIEGIDPASVNTGSLLEVTPPIAAAMVEEKIIIPKAAPTSPIKEEKKKEIKAEVTPPPVPPQEEVQPISEDTREAGILYFAEDQQTLIPNTKAKLIFPARKTESILTMLHLSSAASEGKVVFYSRNKTTKTTSCKTAKPIFVVYLKPDMESVLALDDLEIPIPAEHSIYFTCPGKTFIGINIE
ncbi:MAG: hypothetical protein ACXACP_08205 [Candidatus Hodarchaeales archaeon]|jgi:hypothetical protein